MHDLAQRKECPIITTQIRRGIFVSALASVSN
jgi:hypothetical protein